MLNKATRKPVTLETVLVRENLRAAWRMVKANAGAPGVDGMTVEQTATHLKENWGKIEAEILAGNYKPGAVKAVDIPKGNGGVRRLGIPNVQDRLIQQALHQQLSALWEESFSNHSYGFRPNRSAHNAVRTGQGYIKAGKKWVVDIDLKNFFDEVDHDKLMHQVARKVSDKPVLRLIGKYLRAKMQHPDGSKDKRNKGTPQGGPLSPLLANIYLDPLDKELERRGLSFVRYADDIAIYVSSERAAERVLERVTTWIEKHLKVPVNRDKSDSGIADKTALLGFRLYSDGRIGIAPKAINRFKQRVREVWEARQNLTTEQLREQWRQYSQSWWSYFRLATRLWELNDLNGWIRRHMRKCFWLRWKTPRGRRKVLKRLGVRGRALGNAYSRRGAWAMARHYVTHHALNNQTLNRYGFTLPWSFAKARK